MDITQVSIIHHVAIILILLWILTTMGWAHPVVFFISLLYLYMVNARYTLRLRKRMQYEERKYANQRRLLFDSESVRWLNHAVEKIWPICMEQIASQQFLLPVIPWFLEKYKPWTAKEAVVQHLYLGRRPPMFTDIRVLGESADDDHLVLELGMNFLSADDMSIILAVQPRLGFGIWANMHITGMHVEGKVLVGVKFLRQWPFLGRMRVCFVEPPYFQMTVKPIFNHGVDVTELPGIAGWLDNMLAVAFEQTLVEPNMLVVDVEKFASSPTESWFTVDEKAPIAHAKVEIVEAADLKPSDLNGLADPYVKGYLGSYRFRTKTQKKTLSPKWLEEFKIPITSWEAPNLLVLELCDKDHMFDDMLGYFGFFFTLTRYKSFLLAKKLLNKKHLPVDEDSLIFDHSCYISHCKAQNFDYETNNWDRCRYLFKRLRDCAINMNELGGGQRHDKWLPLRNIKTGRLHLAITVLDGDSDDKEQKSEYTGETQNVDDDSVPKMTEAVTSENQDTEKISTEKSHHMVDEYEAINIEGQEKTGIWVHHPGSEVSQSWEPRKGRARRPETKLQCENNGGSDSPRSEESGSNLSDNRSDENNKKKGNRLSTIKKGMHKIGSIFQSNSKDESPRGDTNKLVIPTPRPNLCSVKEMGTSVRVIYDDSYDVNKDCNSPKKSEAENSKRARVKYFAKNMVKKPANSLKSVLSRKGSFSANEDQFSTDAVDGNPVDVTH